MNPATFDPDAARAPAASAGVPPPDAAPPRLRLATWRSISIGLLGVILINLLTPFNDYVVNNTNLVGNHLPLGLLLFYLAITVLLNAPLSRWRPRWALRRGELALALSMTLVGCAVPSVGMMRYLPGHLTALWYHSAHDLQTRRLVAQLDLPDWLFPTMPQTTPKARGEGAIVRDFYEGTGVSERTAAGRWEAVPWHAWLRPALAWGLLAAALWGAVLCLALIFRRQWTDNERLPYPLATVYLSLIEPPRPGHALNPLLRSRAFWIAAAAVFLTHCLNGLHAYHPQYFPEMPVNYDLSAILANPPFVWIEGSFKAQTVFFTIVGITYFVRSSLSFSIWFIFTAMQGVRMIYGARQVDFTGGMETDQMCGAMLAVGATLLFIARHHLFSVFRQMFTGHRPGQPCGRYLPYAFLGWAFIACLATLVLWLMAAGTTLAGALVIVGLLVLLMLVVMRIVAEGGLLYVLLPIPLNRPWVYLAQDLPTALSGRTTLRSFFFATFFSGMFTHDTREALAGFAPNALRVIDADVDEHEPPRSRWLWPVILWLAVALGVAFVVGGGASLWAHYNYAATLDSRQDNPIGAWGSYLLPRFELDDVAQYEPPRAGPVESHSRPTHLFIGAGLASTLAFLRLRFAWWPLDPLGYLLVYTWGVRQIWFSIFLGWLAKKLLVSYGGANLYRSARPAFLGLIIGETVAAGLWLILSFCLAIQGREYHMIRLLPL